MSQPSVLTALLSSSCNVFDGVIEGYQTVLASLVEHKDLKDEPEDFVRQVFLDFVKAIAVKPQLRRVTALMASSFIAMDRFANGEDYNTAMNESRDACLKAFKAPEFYFDVYRLYREKHDEVVTIVKKAIAKLEDMDDVDQIVMFGAMIDILHQIVTVLRPTDVESVQPVADPDGAFTV